MKKFLVDLPESCPHDFRTLKGIPRIEKGEAPKEVELKANQVESLKRKGLRVVPVSLAVEEEDTKPAAKPRKRKE